MFCVQELADHGAGHPDFGLYAAKQVQKGRPREGQTPERGVAEVKSAGDNAWLTAKGDQVSRYWDRYRLVLVTNTRDFVLVGEDGSGRPANLESFKLADNAEDFARRLEKPRAFAREVVAGLGEYLARTLSHAPRSRNHRIWRGCSPPMPATASPVSKRRAMLLRSRRCATHWKTHLVSASRANAA